MTNRWARRVLQLTFMLAALVPMIGKAAPPMQVGVAAAVRGTVQLSEAPGAVGHDVASGAPIHLGNEVRTGSDSGLQIMLLDETVFTIGPDARITIDQFVFDPDSEEGEVVASVTKGVFRFVSGQIARRKPGNMRVKLPSGTIGIRGTSAAGETDGIASSIVLLGPGPSNNAGARPGHLTVGNPHGSVDLRAPRFGTTIASAGMAPSAPELWSAERLDALTQRLAVRAPGSTAPKARTRTGGSRSADSEDESDSEEEAESNDDDASAQNDADGAADAEQIDDASADTSADDATLSDTTSSAGGDTDTSMAELSGDSSTETLLLLSSDPIDVTSELLSDELAVESGVPTISEFTTFEQLRSITMGFGVFDQEGVPLTGEGGSGSYNFSMLIDFAAQTVEIERFDGAYMFVGSPFVSFTDPILRTPGSGLDYSTETGFANNFDSDGDRFPLFNGDGVRLGVEILNDGNIIAGRLRTQVRITEAATGRVIEGGTTTARELDE